jgi:predicted transcriptional regulator
MDRPETVMENTPDSIRTLADRLDRDIHDDLHLLADYKIIRFEEDGRAKSPTSPTTRFS